MLKIVVSVAVCLAYLCLDGEASAVGANQRDGGNYNNVQNLNPCTEVTCDTAICREQCTNLGFDRGSCKSAIVKCKNNISAKKKLCRCVGKASASESAESSEAENAGEGSSSNATSSETSNPDSSDSSAKKSRNPKPTSISPATNTTTRAVPNAAAGSDNSAGASTASSGVTTSASKATTTPQTSQ